VVLPVVELVVAMACCHLLKLPYFLLNVYVFCVGFYSTPCQINCGRWVPPTRDQMIVSSICFVVSHFHVLMLIIVAVV
jgi:hypothetical protein